ncbi:MAG: hypothetical protein KatS3mg097_296 [Candidatus Parcubacteria bacterium]|nr:MAG: hypothetical protein KatS3mg097_296 [Candidatus Parcubacteria bacterium]
MFYHKYRPQFFKEVIGQDLVIKILQNFLRSGIIPHAYLFSGDKGTGKTTLARIFAKAVNCQNINTEKQNIEPCDQCFTCKLFKQNKFLDIIELDAASNRKIDDIRHIQEHIGFHPLQGKYKVFIIDEAHSLTEEASNALLKTLEEPPKHALFILATTEANKILPTVLSRVQRLDFKKIPAKKIFEKLKKICAAEKIKYEESALLMIAEEAEGSLRDAETLLERISLSLAPQEILSEDIVNDFLGYLNTNKILEFIELVTNKKIKESINFLEEIYSKGFDMVLFLKSVLIMLKKITLSKIDESYLKHLTFEKSQETIERIKKINQQLTIEDLKNLQQVLLKANQQLRYELPSPTLPIELALIEYFRLK